MQSKFDKVTETMFTFLEAGFCIVTNINCCFWVPLINAGTLLRNSEKGFQSITPQPIASVALNSKHLPKHML